MMDGRTVLNISLEIFFISPYFENSLKKKGRRHLTIKCSDQAFLLTASDLRTVACLRRKSKK